MRCFVCGEGTRTLYVRDGSRTIVKVCDICGWKSYPVKIPEAIK